jgi:antitoxin component of RelBE/YafQ-DinJ toxin-antitoxin module
MGMPMNTKLTLRLDDRLIERAKQYADRSGKSVSQLVADYFALIEGEQPMPGVELTPRVRAMVGSLRGATVTEEDYRRHLVEKNR